jgi:hypothetical protein
MTDFSLIGKAARVIEGMSSSKRDGQVMVYVRGGTEAFNAILDPSYEGEFPEGSLLYVTDHFPPRTVVVSPISMV